LLCLCDHLIEVLHDLLLLASCLLTRVILTEPLLHFTNLLDRLSHLAGTRILLLVLRLAPAYACEFLEMLVNLLLVGPEAFARAWLVLPGLTVFPAGR
jgi:hypothetical protein